MFNKYLGPILIPILIFWGTVITWCPGDEITAEKVGAALFTGIKLSREGKYEQRKKALQLLEQAIEQELDLNVYNEEGETLLNYALAKGGSVAVTLLERANVDVNAANASEKQCWTSLHVAVGAGTLYCQEDFVINDVLDKNPKINVRDGRNATPLHYAAAYANGSVVQKLIDRGALINVIDKDRRVPLHWAAFYANITSAEVLLYNYADIDSRDRDRRTPLHLAARVGCVEIINLLLDSGADINAIDLDDNTPLHLAVLHNHTEAMEVLSARDGASTQLKNWAGYEPFALLAGSETRKEYDEKEKEELLLAPAIPKEKRTVSSQCDGELPNGKKDNFPQAKELPNGKRTVSSQGDEELPNGKRNNSPQAEELPNGKSAASSQCDEELPSKKAKVE